MTLKGFHLFFIFLSIVLAVGCAAWAFMNKVEGLFGVASSVAAAGLVVYGICFIRKTRKLIV